VSESVTGYWPSPWPGEDHDAARSEDARDVDCSPASVVTVTSRLALVSTMVVTRDPGEVFLLCHSGGDDAVSWVERIDPLTLDTVARSRDLAAGPAWPGGIAAHANGSLYVVFGRYVHRLNATLDVVQSRELPRSRPYNSFVILPGGELVTKDFGGARPGDDTTSLSRDCELVVLDPSTLDVLAKHVLEEASVARLSARGDEVVVVGVTKLFQLRWNGRELMHCPSSGVTYVEREGQGYGWDAVVTEDDVWFLDNGVGSERYAGSLVGLGVASTGERLVRVSRIDGALAAFEVNDQPGGLVANPPAIDQRRGIAIGYDSSNGVVSAFDLTAPHAPPLWRRTMNQAMHPVILSKPGYVVLNDYDCAAQRDNVVVLDIVTGDEIHRVVTESPLQSVLFAAAGFSNDIYVCSFSHVTRVAFHGEPAT